MSGHAPPPAEDDAEISVLIKTLRVTDQRLEELTAGEVDTVADRDGRSYLLRRAQNDLRYRENGRQAAILNALPANVILLDPNGVIVSANDAWRRLADSNLLGNAAYGVGLNYLTLCDRAWGAEAASARAVAKGIRRVLCGELKRFSNEYCCDTPAGRVWFLLTVTPLDEQPLQGAVVMHVDITAEKQGQQSLLRFAAAMDATIDAIYLIDRAEMKLVHFNDAACRMQNKTRDEIFAGGLLAALGIPLTELERTYDELIGGVRVDKPLELMRRRKDGSAYWLEVRRQALLLDERWTIVSLVRDVTDQKHAEHRIRQLNRVQSMLSGINSLIVRVRDRAELFTEACGIAVEAGGFAMAWIGIVDRGLLEIVPVASRGATEALLSCIEEGLSLEGSGAGPSPTVRVIREKKSVVINDARGDAQPEFSRIYEDAGIRSFAKLPLVVAGEAVGVLALYAKDMDFFHDDEMTLLTELAGDVAFAIDHIEKQEKLEYLSLYDALTGLANRTLFLDRVTQFLSTASSRGQKLALIVIDLERFKNVNDSLGRPAGDDLLRQVAEWLKGSVGDSSRLARVGANHYAIVLPGVSLEADLARLIETTLQAFLKHPFQWNGASYRLAAKTGVAMFPDDGASAETLFTNAEAALKKAKTGSDAYLFYALTMRDTAAGRLSLENQLRQALDDEQFVLHYQPKIDLKTNKIAAAEALIRWNDPHTGLVPPGRFIPILEETGLIIEVGRWALLKAVADYLCWRRAGLAAVRIAVNVSPLQLGNRSFVGEVEKVISRDPLAPAGLELELTESLIMSDVKHSVASLQKIRSLGVTIAIDDFGTGFSSLSYLAKLPINTLKIDRSFVAELGMTPESNALVAMIINLAHSLKLNVVAEGVETESQSSILRAMRCDQAQGYLYSKPIPAAAFAMQFLTWGSS
jgi:diguanylate cyclase (GGDEF)-like protein/PAS domain S-box-containing protein